MFKLTRPAVWYSKGSGFLVMLRYGTCILRVSGLSLSQAAFFSHPSCDINKYYLHILMIYNVLSQYC
jgi:hypothetical protein